MRVGVRRSAVRVCVPADVCKKRALIVCVCLSVLSVSVNCVGSPVREYEVVRNSTIWKLGKCVCVYCFLLILLLLLRLGEVRACVCVSIHLLLRISHQCEEDPYAPSYDGICVANLQTPPLPPFLPTLPLCKYNQNRHLPSAGSERTHTKWNARLCVCVCVSMC